MRKLLIAAVFLIVLTVGCSQTGEVPQPDPGQQVPEPSVETDTVADYFPTEAGVVYVYEGQGNEYASFTMTFDFVEGNRVQQRLDNGGTVLARILELREGTISRVFTREESYEAVNYLQEPDNDQEILLAEPLEPGNQWTTTDGRTRSILNIDETVDTPSGQYQAIIVETKGAEDVVLDYYAKGVGLVKTVFRSGDAEVSSSLKEIKRP